ncbi:MAG: tRNA uridine-5-carboxymethylaminomethyl(34) synthesis GTPase MnmE [Deltaproteobacteria bacterium]|nr:tRNA uridine-5-carboxymethylaminomethyl(34) synthesis GTPase MnmE [Deltaproteobacteria bacterium]
MGISTIAAIATPGGRGGIGIVKLSGPKAVLIATKLFFPAELEPTAISGQARKPGNTSCTGFQSHRLYYGHIIDPENYQMVDEVLLSVMKAPRSYTREDVVEINAHGGPVALNAILKLTLGQGARLAEPGEFTQRAFLNGRIDLTQAEAVIDIISAKSDKALQMAASLVKGELRARVERIREYLIEFLTLMEAAIDFPEDIDEIIDTKNYIRKIKKHANKPLRDLIRQYVDGNVLRDGLKVAVVGRPNVGKSSLLNQLVRRERAIVTDVPGTTRDVIDETLNIDGYPVVLSDTAGLHKTDDPIETIGIEKTNENVRKADLVLFMVEANCSLTAEDYAIFNQLQSKPVIVVINKIDLVNGNNSVELPAFWSKNDWVRISALYNRGIDQLKEQIIETAFGDEPIDVEAAIIPNLRQKLLLEDTLGSTEIICRELDNDTPVELIAIHLKEAIDSLGRIVGATAGVDVLDQIFSRFCIGK